MLWVSVVESFSLIVNSCFCRIVLKNLLLSSVFTSIGSIISFTFLLLGKKVQNIDLICANLFSIYMILILHACMQTGFLLFPFILVRPYFHSWKPFEICSGVSMQTMHFKLYLTRNKSTVYYATYLSIFCWHTSNAMQISPCITAITSSPFLTSSISTNPTSNMFHLLQNL